MKTLVLSLAMVMLAGAVIQASVNQKTEIIATPMQTGQGGESSKNHRNQGMDDVTGEHARWVAYWRKIQGTG